jgi:AcrR family transcriptional regulator
MRLLDTEGETALTFARLGEVLVASPTAVYRHFASRQHLIRAIADHLDELSLDGYAATGDWRADLEGLADRAWNMAVAHPSATAVAMASASGGPNELRAVEAVLQAVHAAGFAGANAALVYQAYVALVLQSSASEGARRAATEGEQIWVQPFVPADPRSFPLAERARNDIRLVDHSQAFRLRVRLFLDGMERMERDSPTAPNDAAQ